MKAQTVWNATCAVVSITVTGCVCVATTGQGDTMMMVIIIPVRGSDRWG